MVPNQRPATCGRANASTWAGVPKAAISRALATVSIMNPAAETLAALSRPIAAQ